METVAKFLSTLFNSRDQAHIFHLQTSSYAAHKALNEYYDEIVDIVDGLVESYQGKYGIITNYPHSYHLPKNPPLAYLESLQGFVQEARQSLPQDSELQNEIDSIATLLNSTCYKLTRLR